MLAFEVGLSDDQRCCLAVTQRRKEDKYTIIITVYHPQVSGGIKSEVAGVTQSLRVDSANACCKVALANHHIGRHVIGERRAKAQNPIAVGVSDPQISIGVKGRGIRIANRAGCRSTSTLPPDIEVRLAQNYAGGLSVGEARGTR